MAFSQEIHGIHQRDTGIDMFSDDPVITERCVIQVSP
jgi:hypothetical protein